MVSLALEAQTTTDSNYDQEKRTGYEMKSIAKRANTETVRHQNKLAANGITQLSNVAITKSRTLTHTYRFQFANAHLSPCTCVRCLFNFVTN